MFRCMGCLEAAPGRNPARNKTVVPDSLVVPSLREALQPFASVIVTGGSSGIGKSFIELGQRLAPHLPFCNLSRRSPAENISSRNLNHFACDLSQPDQIARTVAALEAKVASFPAGQLLLINNSGFGAYGYFPQPDLDHQLEMIDVNVRAVVHLTGALLPLLKTRGGAIMNLASTVAFQPTAYAATYGATKAFVLHWTLALNEELRGTGVRALAVCPGPVETPFAEHAGLRAGSSAGSLTLTPEQIAAAGYRALGARRTMVVPGWKNKIYTFLGSKLPKPFITRLAAKVLARYRLQNTR